MALIQESIAAATAVLGFNLIRDNPLRVSQRARTLRGAALAGSAAALDTEVEVLVGNRQVAKMLNSATGAPTRDHLFPIGVPVGPGEEVSVIVRDAPATNAINILVDVSD